MNELILIWVSNVYESNVLNIELNGVTTFTFVFVADYNVFPIIEHFSKQISLKVPDLLVYKRFEPKLEPA